MFEAKRGLLGSVALVVAFVFSSVWMGIAGVVTASANHSMIAINGDSGFSPANGVVAGSGSLSDPFVISGWNIVATDGSYGISISRTQAHFVVTGCAFSRGMGGVSLSQVTNGIIQGCTVKSGIVAINVQYSADCRVLNNSLDTKATGITIFMSSGIEASGNAINAAYYGVDIQDSASVVMRDNTMAGAGITMGGFLADKWNTHQIDASNTVNGKPIIYYGNAADMTVPQGAGQVILGNCTRMVVSDHTISGVAAGIILGFCSYTKVVGNYLYGVSWSGVVLQYSHDNLVSGNTVRGEPNGILLMNSPWNTVESNRFLQKGGGLFLSESHHATVTGNLFEKTSFGIRVSWSTDCYLDNNSLYGATIDVWGTGPEYWANLEFGDANTVDSEPLVFFKGVADPVVPAEWGELIFVNCGQVSIENQTASGLTNKILLGYCGGVTIANVTFVNCLGGIFAQGVTDLVIKDSAFTGLDVHVALYGCWYTDILRNQFVRNMQSLELAGSSDTLITDNLFKKSVDYAIMVIWESVGNVIYNNAFVGNSWYAAHYGEPSQVYDSSFATSWDLAGVGNYWSDWTSPDENGDGIVDSPYLVAGIARAMDHFPLTASPL